MASKTRRLRRKERRQLLRSSFLDGQRSTAAIPTRPGVVPEDHGNRQLPEDMGFRAASIGQINEDERTVIATLTTEQPVAMYDYRTGKGVVDEVLVARGGVFPEQMVLLDDHSRWGSQSVYGSIRSMALNGDRWRGALHFARNAGQHIDDVWELVRQKHLTDVSLGYRYGSDDYVDIPPGRTLEVDGKTYTAGQRTLRVVTSWSAREGSVTPIGADDQAKIGRAAQNQTGNSQNETARGTPGQSANNLNGEIDANGQQRTNREGDMPKFLQWLQKRGLSESITEQAPALEWAARNLAGDLLSEFTEVCRADGVTFTTAGKQTPPATPPVTGSTVTTTEPGRTSTAETADQIRAERERVDYIRTQAEGVKEDIVQRAVTENWTTTQVNAEFSKEDNRNKRSDPVAGTVHTKGGLTLRTLQAAMLQRSHIEFDSDLMRSGEASHLLASRQMFGGGDDAGWMAGYSRSLQRGGNTLDDHAARAVEESYALRSMSLVDVCRAALDLEGVRYSSYDTSEIIQRSFSTASLNAIFTTNFAAQLLQGFMGVADTTGPWTKDAELPNFQTVERIQQGKFSKLRKTDRNESVKDGDVEAVLESYKLHRYAERFTIDEMDIIDDRFGALDSTPGEMGEAAREIRADLVYSILLGNPAMGQDTTALFHASHGNLTATGAGLSSGTLAARKSAMATQTSNGRLLNIRGEIVIVPETKEHIAAVLLGSSERRDTTSDTEYGTMNWARGKFGLVSEPRLDVGVTDPSTDTTHAGQPGSWFLSTGKGKHGIEVGFLRGTGRAPVVRGYQLTEGRIGRGWLVVMYNAAKAVGYQGLGKSAE